MASPASRRPTNCSLSSIAERSFHGIFTPSPEGESVTHVSGTMCYLCLRPLSKNGPLLGQRVVGRVAHRPSQCSLKYKDICDAESAMPTSSQQLAAGPARETRYFRVARQLPSEATCDLATLGFSPTVPLRWISPF